MTAAAKKSVLESIEGLTQQEQREVVAEMCKRLPTHEQLELADVLAQQAQPVELDPELSAVVSRRIEQLENGEVEAVPWEDAKARILAQLERDRRERGA